jgi:hypothetical protein
VLLGIHKTKRIWGVARVSAPARHFLILNALYRTTRCGASIAVYRIVYGGQVQRKPADYSEHSDHTADLTLLLECMLTVFDLKVLAPIGSDAGERGGAARQRGASFGFGNTARRAASCPDGAWAARATRAAGHLQHRHRRGLRLAERGRLYKRARRASGAGSERRPDPGSGALCGAASRLCLVQFQR